MTLEDYNERILTPMIMRLVEDGKLDRAIQDPDTADMDFGPAVRAAINSRLKTIKGNQSGPRR